MASQLPALVVVLPLASALLASISGWWNRRNCFRIAVIGLAASLAVALALLVRVAESGALDYRLGGWPSPMGIGLHVDHLNGLILVLVSAVAAINLIATRKSVIAEFNEKVGPFYTLYLLFVTGMLGIVVTGDVFNLFVLLEIASITGYALIGMGRDRAPLATLNYVFMGTIGASFYLLGVGHLYLASGSLNMADLAQIVPQIASSNVILFGFIFCMAGLLMKMAFFPLHGWLPNAYCSAPSPAASLIAPLTTKVMIYVMIRVALFVFQPEYVFETLSIGPPIVFAASLAMIAGSILALAQQRLRRMLTYIIVAEVGYMVGGFWLGNRAGITGSILHLINDAVMTLCVFLAAGNLVFRLNGDSFGALKGTFREMPLTMAALAAGGLSIIGVPPTCGFFSKWYLVSGGIDAGNWFFVAALLLSSLMNAILFFRIFEVGFFEPWRKHDHRAGESATGHSRDRLSPRRWREAPVTMLIPLLLVAVGLVVLGLCAGDLVAHFIERVIPAGIV